MTNVSVKLFCVLTISRLLKAQGADESHLTVFPVKFFRSIVARVDLLLTYGGGKHESRILAGYYVFNANILLTFQANVSAHLTYLCFGLFCKFGDF